MLKDLTRADWLRILNIPEERIPAVLILRGTRNFRTQYQAALPFFENVMEVGTPSGILYAFDNPRRQEHLLLSDAEKNFRRAAGNTRMRELAFSLAKELSK
jgi:hypothetical protein